MAHIPIDPNLPPFDYKEFRVDWENLINTEKYKDAEKLCHEGLARQPVDSARGRLYNHLGYLYENFLDDKTFDDILEHYVLSLQVDESNANSHYNLANFLLEQGMQHLLRALELNPNHLKANKRYTNLTPIKPNTTLDLGGQKFQVIEVVDDGVRAVRLKQRNDGEYERTNDDPVYVEISSPEKIHTTTGAGGRTDRKDRPQAFNVDNSNNINNNNPNAYTSKCCYKCVLHWWFWTLLWLIAIAGVVIPVMGYLYFVEEECNTYSQVSTVAANTAAADNKLNMLFLTDCNVNSTKEFNQEYISINSLLSNITNNNDQLDIDYAIYQYCNDPIDQADITLTEYDNAVSITANNTLQSPSGVYYLSDLLRVCQDTYDALSTDDIFLCLPFVSSIGYELDGVDLMDSMLITNANEFANIYLSFMIADNDETLYATLGSFGTSSECLIQSQAMSYGNTWWSSSFYCNDDTDTTNDHHSLCPHCFNYELTDSFNCGINEFQSLFTSSSGGITMEQIEELEECSDKYDKLWFYCIGGVVPLIFWVFIVIIVLCCAKCKNKNENGGDDRETAYV